MHEEKKTKDELIYESLMLHNLIDELKSAEIERKKIEEELKDKERFLSNVFSSIQDGISVLDRDMVILRVNPTIEKWYKHAMPLVGKKCYTAYHGRSEPCEICPTQKTLRTGNAAYEIVPKIGEDRKVVGWLELYSFPLIDRVTGRLSGVIEYVRDITARKRAEEEREKLNEEVLRSSQKLKQQTLKDAQTGLYNYRYLEEIIEAEYCRARRYGHSLSVIMIDIDYFKSINDVYGHEFGDRVLKQFARKLKGAVRRYDIVIRFGGEEFIVLLPGVDRQKAMVLGRRLMETIKRYNFGNDRHSVKLKLSLAVISSLDDKVVSGMNMVDAADKILDKAKEDGGDRIYSSQDIKAKKISYMKKGAKKRRRY